MIMELWLAMVISMQLSSLVLCQSNPDLKDFISIDCGAPSGTSYEDSKTGIKYVSDDSYIDTGINYNISESYTNTSKQSSTLRSFPNGTRNCYTINATEGSQYLLRATFLYGNYDGNQTAQASTSLQFDLNLDTTFWRRVNITDASKEYAYEIVTKARSVFMWLCLVDINAGTPFISALELRPFEKNLYEFRDYYWQSNAILFRLNYGTTKDTIIRYPDDPYDRIWSWYEYNTTILTSISTEENITKIEGGDFDYFEAPISVLQTALTPISSPNLTTVPYYNPSDSSNFDGYYVVLYFAELQKLSANQSRQFNIYLNDDEVPWDSDVKPKYLKVNYSYHYCADDTYSHFVHTLTQTTSSALPPILNAMEAYWTINMEYDRVIAEDVGAMMDIKKHYQIVKNWNGDPCYPTNVSWEGVNCTNDGSWITSLNLSHWGLNGSISGSFAKLDSLQKLDLSYNKLSGDIPDSFSTLQDLQVLNLMGNVIGHVPDTLLKRNSTGNLQLLVDCYTSCGVKSRKHSSTFVIAIIVAAVSVVLSIAAVIFLLILYRRTTLLKRGTVEKILETQVHSEIKRFTYHELKDITNNFSCTIGKGGFGVVYHGYLQNHIEVAVKICSPESAQGSKQFLAEVKSLSLVHHKNLVTLIGYCKEGDDLAVVYEYMPRGSLFDHLRGKGSTSEPLNWRMRLNIVLEAAQGLDYLHAGCGIVHRDIKSNNILLGQNFEAKISDLGLARMFTGDGNTSLITVCGTPGYIDPEYQGTLVLTEKSDVYSFGVILLEIVTGKPPILNSTENIHIVNLAKENLDKGNIEDVIDSRLKREYDMNSMCKVVELAMLCTKEQSAQRPTMADVVIHLKGSVQMEEHRQKELQPNDKSDTDMNISSISTSSSITKSFVPATR